MVGGASRILDGEGHGYGMRKLRVVEARICRVGGGFGRGVERFVGFGLRSGVACFWAGR